MDVSLADEEAGRQCLEAHALSDDHAVNPTRAALEWINSRFAYQEQLF